MNWSSIALVLCLVAAGVGAGEPPVRRKVLLLDSTLLERSENIGIAAGRPVKYPGNPLFGEDRPWEQRIDNMYPNVIWDPEARLFRCWYSPFIIFLEDWLVPPSGSTSEVRLSFSLSRARLYSYETISPAGSE